ncbi:MAG: hypothetical protein JXA54_06000 [Candidatus Heimdallarchaeota archaeon]|nr:hypothetical protein [Candidatus Heimdallarchaeota archaeon]
MNIKKILKNRKAMTPLMIGIIVAASLLAVIFIVLATTIPYVHNDVSMSVQLSSIRGNVTCEQLKFRIIVDYDDGYLTDVEIFNDQNVKYGKRNDLGMNFTARTQKYIGFRYFEPIFGIPSENVNATSNHLLFIVGNTYTLRIYYANMDGIAISFADFQFVYKF